VALDELDRLIASSGRLRILTPLAGEARIEFVRLRQQTSLTDGNLACHARRLESAGFVAVEKTFKGRKPVTHLSLTASGRRALERHARELLAALGQQQRPREHESLAAYNDAATADDWVD
jgi:DNA-binding MarR family transcriptional regulator